MDVRDGWFRDFSRQILHCILITYARFIVSFLGHRPLLHEESFATVRKVAFRFKQWTWKEKFTVFVVWGIPDAAMEAAGFWTGFDHFQEGRVKEQDVSRSE